MRAVVMTSNLNKTKPQLLTIRQLVNLELKRMHNSPETRRQIH